MEGGEKTVEQNLLKEKSFNREANIMRKSSLWITKMLMVGAVAFTVTPAFADYNQSDVMLDQADNSVFGMGSVYNTTAGPGNSVGLLADENPMYGPGTIEIPYHSYYGFPGCGTVNGGVISSDTLQAQSSAYGCGGAADAQGIDVGLIIQDLFTEVSEGQIAAVKPVGGDRGISQFMDSLFAYSGLGNNAPTVDDPNTPLINENDNSDQGSVYINQTLDQDLADITAAGNLYGIWDLFHQAFTHTENAELGTIAGVHTFYDHDGIDQTVIGFLSEESGPSTVEIAALGEVRSYMAQWFQMGENESCTQAETNLGVNLCDHTEFGGHGTVTSSRFDPSAATAAHDP